MGIHYNLDDSITLHQTKYINDMLFNFKLEDANNPAPNPMAVGLDETADSLELSQDVPYASLVGSLNYATVCNRPDISFAVSTVCTHMKQQPTQNHWQAAKRVLRYLKGTKHYGLTYSPSNSDDMNIL